LCHPRQRRTAPIHRPSNSLCVQTCERKRRRGEDACHPAHFDFAYHLDLLSLAQEGTDELLLIIVHEKDQCKQILTRINFPNKP